MPFAPFLTDFDRRAEVKGSVDPLGAMSIWSRLGRRVVGNLTTVTSSVSDFKTLVLGFALMKDVRELADETEESDDLAVFLRWELLAAYTRAHVSGDSQFRGMRKVRQRLSDGVVVPISAERDCQILGNQKVYGLWGLYTVAARASGLVQAEINDLTSAADAFVDSRWRPSLKPVWPTLLKVVAEDNRRFNLDKYTGLLKALSKIWKAGDEGERAFWRNHLVEGGSGSPIRAAQRELAKALAAIRGDEDFMLSRVSVLAVAKGVRKAEPALADALLDIAACESVLAPSSALFSYLQTLDRQSLDDAIAKVSSAWDATVGKLHVDAIFPQLQGEILAAVGSPVVAAAWLRMHEALAAGHWRQAVEGVIEVNRLVMDARGGAPWLSVENGLVRVRLRDEAASLPQAEELARLWRNTYFLDSLRTVTLELGA